MPQVHENCPAAKHCLKDDPDSLTSLPMKLLCAFAVWIGMGVVLGTGILMAVKGSPWLLIAGMVGFVIAVGKIGCATH